MKIKPLNPAGWTRRWFCLITLFGFGLLSPGTGPAAEVAPSSQWDKNLLSVELGEVSVQANSLQQAWMEMGGNYLLRANLYLDAAAYADRTPFDFHQTNATGKDVFDAFLTTYPALTYTQDPLTGIIWFHPKRVKYSDILSQKIRIAPGAGAVPMYPDVYVPLCNLLAPKVLDFYDPTVSKSGSFLIDRETHKMMVLYAWLYDVSLPAGIYSAREILDFCCVANPTKAFQIYPEYYPENRHPETLVLFPQNLIDAHPPVPPRTEAVKYWELALGRPTNGAPCLEEIRVAMSDPDPTKRVTASLYVEACFMNYAPIHLIGEAVGSEQAVWTVLGEEYAEWRDDCWKDARADFFGEMKQSMPRLDDDLKHIKNPNLALLVSLQLPREQPDTSYLDAMVRHHTYTAADIASIQPELYRMARASATVRDKLRAMKSPVPALSPAALDELANTNYLSLIPTAGK